MTYNIKNNNNLEQNYQQGLLPQRNNLKLFYEESSCRSNLENFSLSSENRRILRKTDKFTYELVPITFNLEIKKQIFNWLKILKWDFPMSAVKNIFTNHIFNYLYIWKDGEEVVAYSICLFEKNISHIGYVFYNPKYSHDDLPVRLVLQFIIDSHDKKLNYAYLGRYSEDIGYYKRNMPNFEYFKDGSWISKI